MWQCGEWWCATKCLMGAIWSWHPPIGVWIGLLGFLGVYVTLAKDPKEIGRREKAAWIFVMFALLLLEVKSVYQDRSEHDREQAMSRERSEENFRTIADGIHESISRSDVQFKATMEASDRHFNRTMKQFFSVGSEQLALAQNQQDMFDSENGHLIPASDGPVPTLTSLGCPATPPVPPNFSTETPPNDYYILQLNELKYVVWKFPFVAAYAELWPEKPTEPIAQGISIPLIVLRKVDGGDVRFSTEIRDRSGFLLIRFDDDGFYVGAPLQKRHPNKSTLIVMDQMGGEVMKVEYINKHFIRVRAHVIVGGRLLFNPSQFGNYCMFNQMVIISEPHNY